MTLDKISIKKRDGKFYVRDVREVTIPTGNVSIPYRKREELFWRELPQGKPDLYPFISIHQEPHGHVCYECGKCRADGWHWQEIVDRCNKSDDSYQEYYINSDGNAVCISKKDIEGNLLSVPTVWIWTNKEFAHRDYCSEECYKKARNRTRKEQRNKNLRRQKKRCQICGKDISDKNAGALTCGDSCRKKRERMRRATRLVS